MTEIYQTVKGGNGAESSACLREYVESILRGLVCQPQRVGGSVRIVSSLEFRAVEVDLDCFDRQDRARLIGTAGETATAIRTLLKSVCGVRGQRCHVHYADGGRALPPEEMRRYGLPPATPGPTQSGVTKELPRISPALAQERVKRLAPSPESHR